MLPEREFFRSDLVSCTPETLSYGGAAVADVSGSRALGSTLAPVPFILFCCILKSIAKIAKSRIYRLTRSLRFTGAELVAGHARRLRGGAAGTRLPSSHSAVGGAAARAASVPRRVRKVGRQYHTRVLL